MVSIAFGDNYIPIPSEIRHIAGQNGGLPYLDLGVYGDDGRPLFIDGSEKSTFFEFENDKKGRGFPSAIETYRDANGEVACIYNRRHNFELAGTQR